MRVIRVADLVGAAQEHMGGFYAHENWDGGLGLSLGDLELDGVGNPDVADRPPEVEEAPVVVAPRRLLKGASVTR